VLAVGLAGSGAVALAPSASAYYGGDAEVRATLLSVPRIAALAEWDTGSYPLQSETGRVTEQSTNVWQRIVVPSTYPADQVAPLGVQLAAVASPSARNADFMSLRGYYAGQAEYVHTNTTTTYTFDALYPAGDGLPALRATTAMRKAGSDGLAFGLCVAPAATTTTTAGERGNCANRLVVAQAAAWAAKSPALVWRTSPSMKKKLLTVAAATKATKLSSRNIRVQSLKSKSMAASYGGRLVSKGYKFRVKNRAKVKVTIPSSVGAAQFGNRLNATVAFTYFRFDDQADAGKLYDRTSTRYTYMYKSRSNGETLRIAATMQRYGAVIVTASCTDNPYKRASAKSLRTCSKRLTSAQLKKLKPSFSRIR
jgi:hypothetical protein